MLPLWFRTRWAVDDGDRPVRRAAGRRIAPRQGPAADLVEAALFGPPGGRRPFSFVPGRGCERSPILRRPQHSSRCPVSPATLTTRCSRGHLQNSDLTHIALQPSLGLRQPLPASVIGQTKPATSRSRAAPSKDGPIIGIGESSQDLMCARTARDPDKGARQQHCGRS